MSQTQSQDGRRPKPFHNARSFSRPDPPALNTASPTRTRASTIQTPIIAAVPDARPFDISPEIKGKPKSSDIFEASEEHDDSLDADLNAPGLQQPGTLEQLPIEIRSLTERFLKSLSAKAHAAPLNIDAISELFQDFYVQAESHIATHIAALATKLSREKSPAPSVSSRTSATSKGRARANSNSDKGLGIDDGGGDQQMLTASEITDRRKARRLLELQRLALEEAVERGICEKVYDRIYRHRSTDDEERDAKLRSKTAALSLVGIGLKELHVDVDSMNKPDSDASSEANHDINRLLIPARESLQRMDDEHFPLGKLQHLTAAHKSIVETLSHLFPSSSSADEVLPTLIYTLITSPAESINVYSALHFIQLFRAAGKVDGEAAYCLVNLEAAISFLETVDLSSLRADEFPEGPTKGSSGPTTPLLGSGPGPNLAPRSTTPGLSPVSITSQDRSTESIDGDMSLPLTPASPTTTLRPVNTNHRRLSSLIQAQAERIEAGRDTFLNSADQAFDSINSTLENSFKFLFGRLKEQESEGHGSPILMPKTLEDARKLVSPPITEEEDDGKSASGRSSIMEKAYDSDDPLTKPENKMLELVGGRRALRDRSTDSARSGNSSKHVAFISTDGQAPEKPASSTPPSGPVDAVGNLMNTLNPLNRFSVPSFSRFGRSVSGPAPPAPTIEKRKQISDVPEKARGDGPLHETDLNAAEALAQLRKTKPPLRRFVEMRDAKELKIGEIEDLLKDYKRLAEALREAVTA